MKWIIGTFFPLLVGTSMLALPALSNAQMFRYVDKDGVLHFTNVPTLPNQVKTQPFHPMRQTW